MKNILVILLLSIAFFSCSNLEEMNINPNLPTETHPQLLLTNVEWDAFRANGGTSPLYAQKMLVQTDGKIPINIINGTEEALDLTQF